jgi:hypothetical protein
MYKKQSYWGCEMESLMYRKILAENNSQKILDTGVSEYKPKRGKQKQT